MEWNSQIQEKCSENLEDEASNWTWMKWVQSEVSNLGDRVEVISLNSRETPAEIHVVWGRQQFCLSGVPHTYEFLKVTVESVQLYLLFGYVCRSDKVTFGNTKSQTRLYKP